jgi:hypothetical protein
MSSWKAMPLFPKILIVCLALGVIYIVGNHRDDGGGGGVSPLPTPVEERGTDSAGGSRQELAGYESQLSQLITRVNQCQAQVNAVMAERAAAVANGMMPGSGPACEQSMPQWTVQWALLSTYIARLKTGNTHLTVCEANPGLRGCESLEASSRSSSSSSSDDGTEVVERSTRQGIRGTTLYTVEGGEQHDLPTRDYYYRDRNTGQFVGSDSPNPPDNVHDYEPLQPER